MSQAVIHFKKSKETKGTIVYKEEGDDQKIGSLYLKKAAATALGNPENVTVTVEAS